MSTAIPPLPPETLYQEAADWLEEMSCGPLDDAGKQQLQRWLRDNAQGAAILERMLSTWEDPALMQALTDAQRASDTAVTVLPTRRNLTRSVAFAAAASLLLAVGGVTLHFQSASQQTTSTAEAAAAYQTSATRDRTFNLRDGSSLTLAARSALDVDFRKDSREISLTRGGAYFAVAKDPTRPFTVRTDSTRVTAVGTAFSVDRLRDGLEVRVYEGRVKVSRRDGRPPEYLNAGEQLRQQDDGRWAIDHFPLDMPSHWQSGWMTIDSEPLGYLIDHLSRYSDTPISAHGNLRNQPVAGRFNLRDPEATLALLRELYTLETRKENDRIILSAR
ncbi:FecR family protein [Microbulbifer celer]|uniref:FecR family protein n=1 Tax=Microbulbifer celer TaxID=435905 RepID=A0ABW3UBB4_9GAMM|nr:FecR domain-containing protein [Microbulbifer celer]UFN56328.1 FecR domain-containing protein [Microbulbifer celer]